MRNRSFFLMFETRILASMTDDATTTTTALKPWEPGGPSPSPAGRGKGHLNKFSKAFLQSVSAKWREHGDAVLEEVRRDDPGLFLRVCASLIPKELLVVTHSTTPVAQMTEKELQGGHRRGYLGCGTFACGTAAARGSRRRA